MLTLPEKILFALAVIASLYLTYHTFNRMYRIVRRGPGRLNFDHLPQRLMTGLMALISQGRIIRHRPLTSVMHYLIAWGFIFYGLVNVIDVLEGYIPGFRFLGDTLPGGLYRLVADVLSVGVLVGMSYFLIRRFIPVRRRTLTYHDNVKLQSVGKHPPRLAHRRRIYLVSRRFPLFGRFIFGRARRRPPAAPLPAPSPACGPDSEAGRATSRLACQLVDNPGPDFGLFALLPLHQTRPVVRSLIYDPPAAPLPGRTGAD
ncbi:MAG: hypothetical protein U0401_09710 [Anaerolineae bacterium]